MATKDFYVRYYVGHKGKFGEPLPVYKAMCQDIIRPEVARNLQQNAILRDVGVFSKSDYYVM